MHPLDRSHNTANGLSVDAPGRTENGDSRHDDNHRQEASA